MDPRAGSMLVFAAKKAILIGGIHSIVCTKLRIELPEEHSNYSSSVIWSFENDISLSLRAFGSAKNLVLLFNANISLSL